MRSSARRRRLFPQAEALLLLVPFVLLSPPILAGEDCNGNRIDDEQDLAAKTSQDCNRNGIPDECDLASTHLRFEAPLRIRAVTPPGESLQHVVAGDFNRDGSLDLVYDVGGLDAIGNRASILFGKGDGTFGKPTTILSLKSLGGLTAADLNGDGNLDLVLGVIDNGTFLDVLLGNGDGTFGKPQTTRYAGSAGEIVAADFDGDGALDFLMYSQYWGGITLLRNGGAGTFVASTVEARSQLITTFVVTGDFDDDEDVDLVVSHAPTEQGFLLFRNRGDGSFDEEAGRNDVTPPGPPPVGDFDGDGDLDLMVAGGEMAPNRGDGTFDPPIPTGLTMSSRTWGYWTVAADIDRNRSLDLVLFTSGVVALPNQVGLALARNRGDGTFRAPEFVPLDSSFAKPVLVEDLNHDGAPDIVATDRDSGGILILLGAIELVPASPDVNGNRIPDECETDCDRDDLPDTYAIATGRARDCNGNGIPDSCDLQPVIRFEKGDCIAPGGNTPRSLAVADLNGDEHLDLAFLRNLGFDANPSPQVFESATRLDVFINSGDGSFVAGQELTFEAPLGSVAAGDLDGDDFPDLFGTQGVLHLVMALRNDGGGAFELLGDLGKKVQHPHEVNALDLNGDGRLDLLVEGGVNDDYTATAFFKGGLPAFTPGVSFQSGGRIAAIVDLDQDGAPDLITDYPTASISVTWNDGTGTFRNRESLAAGSFLASADSDGDGDVDLAIDDRAAAEWYVLLNRGNRTLERGPTIPRTVSIARFTVIDVDGDGDPDLAAPTGDQKLAVFPGDGRGGFGAALLTETPLPFAAELFPGDFDRDGKMDLVAMGQGCLLSVLFNRTPPPAILDGDRDGIPDGCAGASGGQVPSDANQDGKLDIADAVSLLGRLFLGIVTPWPCDGGGREPGPTDVRLLDANGDGALDIADPIHVLSHLFVPESPAPALGTSCAPLAGCPDRCIP